MTLNKNQIPPSLLPGSTIGIVAPSGRVIDHQRFEKGVKILHEMGFKTKFPRKLWPGSQYFADTDSKRSQEFNSIWNDAEVNCVMAARGGYGCIRMANRIDAKKIRQNPKLFLGFSDITLLHSQFNSKANLVTLLGPVVTSLSCLSKKSLDSLHSLLSNNISKWKYSGNIEILKGKGTVIGQSTGGNLSTILSTLGTEYEISWQDKIVFLEDTNEESYRIDRMLTQLSLSGKLQEASAIVLGDFSHGLNLDRIEIMRHHENIWNRVMELTEDKKTVWANIPIGHGPENHTIPLGANIVLNSDEAEMRCLKK